MPPHALSRRIADVLDLQPDSHAIEYGRQWISWREVGDTARRVASLVADHAGVGMLLRNRPGQVAAFLGVLLAGGTVVTINPSRGDDRTRADIAALDLPLVIGAPDDLASLVLDGPTVLPLSGLDAAPQISSVGRRVSRPGVAVRMLTSGTTG